MSSLRQQFTQLAQELSAEAERRRQFVVKNREETQRLCDNFRRDREQLAQQIQHQTRKVCKELTANRETIRRSVARTLVDLQSRRSRRASDQRIQCHRFVASIQRSVANSLQRHRAALVRNARQRALTSMQTMNRIRNSVAMIRNESIRLTSTSASDRMAGRRALAVARSRRPT